MWKKDAFLIKCRSKATTRISATAPFSQAEAFFLLGDLVENSTYCNFHRIMLFFNTMDFSHQSKQRFPRFPLPTLPPQPTKKMTQISTIRMASGHSGQALSVLVFFLGIGSVLFSSAPGKIAFFRWRNLGAILLGSCWHQTPTREFENRWVLQKLCLQKWETFYQSRSYYSIYQERVRWQLWDEFCFKTFV